MKKTFVLCLSFGLAAIAAFAAPPPENSDDRVLCQGVWPIGLSDVFLSSYDVDTFREVEEVGCSRGTFDECAVEAIDVAVLGSED